MTLECKRLTPRQFLDVVDLAPEWSLAAVNGELVLYVRYIDEGVITMYLGPGKAWCSDLELAVFHFKVKSRIIRAKGMRL
jgi:hypothetical protein